VNLGGQRASLDRQRLAAVEGETLAPIDWSVRRLASCCPRSGTAMALADTVPARACPACGAPLVVAAHGVLPRELELELRGGTWWLARRP
jgi:hypothetical protein